MKPLIIFATVLEATDTLKRTNAIAKAEELYSFDKADILITGMGLEQTERAVTKHIEHASALINFGIAGALRQELAVGSIHNVRHVASEDFEKIGIQKDGLRLLSVIAPLFDPKARYLNSYHFDLVDMEGYAIAKVAQMHGKPCFLYKIISDHCTSDGSCLIKERLPMLSQRLAQALAEIFLTNDH